MSDNPTDGSESSTDGKNPREMLEEIHQAVVGAEDGSENSLSGEHGGTSAESNWKPPEDSNYIRVMLAVKADQPVQSTELVISGNTTRPLTALWRSGYLRRSEKRPYEYELSQSGRELLEEYGKTGLDGIVEEKESVPWDDSEATKKEYAALQAIAESQGHPTTSDAGERYGRLLNIDSGTNKLSATLNRTHRKGWVERTPERPYYYWLTESGEQVYERAASPEVYKDG